jgi:hypothetical protein
MVPEASRETLWRYQHFQPTAVPSKHTEALIVSPVVHTPEHHPLRHFAPPQQAQSAEPGSVGLAEDWLEGSSVCRGFAILRTAAYSSHPELLRFL